MMRKLFIVCTLLFWLAVAGFWVGSTLQQDMMTGDSEVMKAYSQTVVAGHNSRDDCWMIIDGMIYDVSTYLPKHPSAPEIVIAWCGREATKAYQTKTIGRPHSSHAGRILSGYRIGRLDRDD
jgi:cytochrome b involved in lipid metabolism